MMASVVVFYCFVDVSIFFAQKIDLCATSRGCNKDSFYNKPERKCFINEILDPYQFVEGITDTKLMIAHYLLILAAKLQIDS